MANTPTPKLGLLRPVLGTKPWKAQVDFNWLVIDQNVGGLKDGTVAAGLALNISPAALTPFILDVTGTFSGVSVGASGVVDITVDHSLVMVFDLPEEPIVSTPAGVICTPVMNRNSSLDNVEYGGKFGVQINNNTGGTVDGSTITWRRKGLKL